MNKQEKTSHRSSASEAISSSFLPVSASLAATHELNAHGYISTPFIEQFPGIEHSSSAAGGALVGMVGGVISERFATIFENKGQEASAEKVRRFGAAITFMGSLATQLALESALIKGTPDTLDVVVGLAATVPGIIAGRSLAKKKR